MWSVKNVAVFTKDGAFALFFRPHPGGFDSSRDPTAGNLPFQAKKMANARGSARGDLGAAGNFCPTRRAGGREPLERGWRNGRGTPRVSPSRAPVFFFAHYFQTPATQALEYGAVHSHQDPPTPGKRVRLPRSTLHNFSRIPPISIAS